MATNDDHPLIQSVRDSWNDLVPPPYGVVVAVSGGPDSVALTLALHNLNVRPLVIGHVNHQLRSEDSEQDEAFVIEFGRKLGIPIEVRRVETRLATQGDNLEATARRQRYEQLENIARQSSSSFIATGHTADDQAETVLFRLLRGSGLRGLAGIPRKRRWHDVTIVRPLLAVRRAVVMDYLQSCQQPFRTDSSNIDMTFSRNRIRHQVIPELERTLSPDVVNRLTQLADRAADWEKILNQRVRRLLRRSELARSAALVILDPSKLFRISHFLLCEIGRHVWRREHWPQRDMSAKHWHRLAEVMLGGVSAVDFPGGISARRLPRVVRLGPGA